MTVNMLYSKIERQLECSLISLQLLHYISSIILPVSIHHIYSACLLPSSSCVVVLCSFEPPVFYDESRVYTCIPNPVPCAQIRNPHQGTIIYIKIQNHFSSDYSIYEVGTYILHA